MQPEMLEKKIIQNRPTINSFHEENLLHYLLAKRAPNKSKKHTGKIWFLLKLLSITIIVSLITLPTGIKLVRALGACNIETECLTNYWKTTNQFGDQITVYKLDGGGIGLNASIITKVRCENILDVMNAEKVSENSDNITYRLQSGHTTACTKELSPNIPTDSWNIDPTNLTALETNQLNLLIFGESYKLTDDTTNYDFYYQEEFKPALEDSKLATLLDHYGAKFLESFDGCDYFKLSDQRYKLSWCKKEKYIEIIDLQGTGSVKKTDPLFQDLIQYLQKGDK